MCRAGRHTAGVLRRLAVLLAAALLGACGSEDDPAAFPPPSGPVPSPRLAEAPEGRVIDLGGRANALAVHPREGVVAVALSGPERLVFLDVRTLRVRRRGLITPEDRARWLDVASTAVLDDGGVAEVDDRARTLTVGRERVPAGVGPTQVEAGDDGRVYVADTGAGALLFFRTRPDLALVRRTALPGAPYATAIDRERGKLWVTLTARNRVVQLTADGQPRVQRGFPTVRQPNAVAIHEPSGRVFVASAADGTLQAFAGYPER